jgi:hypothetical protein
MMMETFKRAILKDIPHEDEWTKAMRRLSRRLEEVDERFNQALDGDLIEACIYERLAIQAQYRYLLRCAKAWAGYRPPAAVPMKTAFGARRASEV